MHVVVEVSGGQGWLPKEVEGSPVRMEAFAQDIIDRYGNSEYYDDEAIEYWEVDGLWYRIKAWLKAHPFKREVV